MKFTTVVELLRGWVSSLIRSKLAYFDLETCTKLWNPLFNSYSMRDFTWHGCFLKVSTISSTWLQFLGMPQMYDHFVICNRCCQYYKAFTRTRDGNKKKNHPLAPRGIPWPKQTTYLWDIWCITIIFFWITGDFFHLYLHKNSIEHLQWKERKHFHTLKTISSLNCPDLVHSGEYVHNFVLIQVQCNKMWHSVTTYKR